MKFFVFLLFLYVFLHVILNFMCAGNKTHTQQLKDYKKCKDHLSMYEMAISNYYSRKWLEKVDNVLNFELSHQDKIRFATRQYIECYKKLSKYVANKYMCEEFDSKYVWDDIYGHGIVDVEECIKKINDAHLNEVNLYVPKVEIKDLVRRFGIYVSRRSNLNAIFRMYE